VLIAEILNHLLSSAHIVCLLYQILISFNYLKTKSKPLYLKAQFAPRIKHFSSRL